MNQAEFETVTGELTAAARGIETSKRPGYTVGSDDVLANFKRAGERAGVSTEQAWAVFFLKHVDAIVSIMTRPDLPVSEAAEGRFADAINYLRLGYGIYRERTIQQPAAPLDRMKERLRAGVPLDVINRLWQAEGGPLGTLSVEPVPVGAAGFVMPDAAKMGGR